MAVFYDVGLYVLTDISGGSVSTTLHGATSQKTAIFISSESWYKVGLHGNKILLKALTIVPQC